MTTSLSIKAAVGGVIILVGVGALIVFSNMSSPHMLGSSQKILVVPPAQAPEIHTAAWYVAHPDVLKVDEQRCAGDAATLPQAACQNIASADAQVAGADYAKAAATLSGASGTGAVQTQKSP